MISRLRHVGMRVADLDRSVEWYSQWGFRPLGIAKEEWLDGENTVDIKVAKLANALGQVIELIEGDWPQYHISLTVGTIPMGVDVVRSKETKMVSVAYILDPDGNHVELVKELRYYDDNSRDRD
jgi:catechol 2,3-dioxygenase-like lactoylglutathione lyase family enzyme